VQNDVEVAVTTMSCSNKAQSGFSLVELLVAVTILAVGLLGLAELQITAMKANSQSDTITVATSVAKGVLEKIKAKNRRDEIFDVVGTAQQWSFDPDDTASGHILEVEGAGSYVATYDIDLGPSDDGFMGVPDLCQIRVRVSSQGMLMGVTGLKQRSVELSTLKRIF